MNTNQINKKVYTPPQITRLGDVRDVTRGGGAAVSDGGKSKGPTTS